MDTIQKKLTKLNYFIFFFLGLLFTNWGILLIFMSKTYHVSLATLGFLFFIPTASQAVTTLINGHFLQKVNLKTELLWALSIMILGIALMLMSHSVSLLILSLFFIGIATGILIALPNFIIIATHPKNKFKKLNLLNFFYSFGAIIGPFIAGILLNFSVPWKVILSLDIFMLLAMIYYAFQIPFSHFKATETDSKLKEKKIPWHLSIYLIALSMLLYVLSERIFSIWIVAYLHLRFHYSIAMASTVLTIFWFFIAVGRFSAKYFSRIPLYVFILLMSSLAMLSYFVILFLSHIYWIYLVTAIMGMGFSSLYASTLAYGTDQVEFTCPKLMSFFVLSGTVGSIISFPISSFFINHFSIFTTLATGCVMMLILVIVILLTTLDKKNPHSFRYRESK